MHLLRDCGGEGRGGEGRGGEGKEETEKEEKVMKGRQGGDDGRE